MTSPQHILILNLNFHQIQEVFKIVRMLELYCTSYESIIVSVQISTHWWQMNVLIQ